ncbi:MAG: TonB-dependent receptor [Candidatus Eisenbacteria bacterium]|nr:TonB-dependent receptor [Candidatus Eisenbacteria bacterium]
MTLIRSRKPGAKTVAAILLLLLSFIGADQLFAGTIHGFVRDKASREPIIMGNVLVKNSTIGTNTNTNGYYVLPSLKPGTYEIQFSYVGYRPVVATRTLGAGDEIELDALLEVEPVLVKETVVTAERHKRELDIKPSEISIQMPQLRSIPQIAEPDLFRSVQMLPGVATLSDFSAGLYIRGGSADQNLILLDHIDVYNPNHMFGFFSTFNTDAIKSVELLKGGFPAMYGGRLSSVLNVYNKEGDREKCHGVTRLSLLSASSTLEGPWKKGSWMVSGRRTYLDLAAKMVKVDLPYYFYDAHAKLNYDIDRHNQASVSFYLGNDRLDLSGEGGTNIALNWGNRTFSTRWMHLFSSKLFSNFVFAGTRFDSDTEVNFDNISFGLMNRITDLAIKGMLTYSPSTDHSMDFGFENKMLDFKLNYHIVDTDYRSSFSGDYSAVYLQDNYRVSTFNILQTGLRFDHYTDGSYSRLMPRVSLKHLLTDRTSVTASYGRYSQFLNQVDAEGMSFAEMWFPVDRTFKPGAADHYILGYSFDNARTFSFSLEGYYKKYLNIAEFRQFRGADENLSDQTAAQNFYSGKGEAYGADALVRNNIWGLEGWVGYSLSRTKKQINGYNFDKEYYPTYDRRHTVTTIQDYRINKKYRVNLAFKYGSGQPYTEATARYAVMNPNGTTHNLPLDGEKNFYRLPAYHRLDIGIFYETKKFLFNTEVYFQVVNVYNHRNVWFRRYKTSGDTATVEDYSMIPLLPTAGVSFRF